MDKQAVVAIMAAIIRSGELANDDFPVSANVDVSAEAADLYEAACVEVTRRRVAAESQLKLEMPHGRVL